MTLKELLQILGEVAVQNGINPPYIVGGIPRDIILDKLTKVNDIDITTGNEDVHRLANLFAQKLGVEAKTMKDGHKKVVYDGISVDFSSNFTYDNIDDILRGMRVEEINGLVRETYSRDFTANTLLIPLDFSRVIDITGKGIEDVRGKILRCPVRCGLAFEASPMRIIRAFYYSAKHDFKIPENMRHTIANNLELLKEVDDKYKSDKISEVLRDEPKMINDLIELGVLQHVPLTKEISRMLIDQKRLTEVL